MFDTHAHLNFDTFDENLDDVIQSCRTKGITSIMIPGTDIASSRRAMDIADEHEGVYAAVGIHPADITDNPPQAQEAAESMVSGIRDLVGLSTKIKAIGEIGLDRYYIYRKNKSFDETIFQHQVHVFTAQFRLAKDLHKAVIIHNRESKKDVLRVLENNWDAYYSDNVVLHCMEPDDQLLDFAISHNIFIGVDGDITYNEGKQAFIHKIPLDRLVIETDSPFLTPEPVRQQPDMKFQNSPEYLPLIAQKVADLVGEDVSVIQRITTENAKKLFNL